MTWADVVHWMTMSLMYVGVEGAEVGMNLVGEGLRGLCTMAEFVDLVQQVEGVEDFEVSAAAAAGAIRAFGLERNAVEIFGELGILTGGGLGDWMGTASNRVPLDTVLNPDIPNIVSWQVAYIKSQLPGWNELAGLAANPNIQADILGHLDVGQIMANQVFMNPDPQHIPELLGDLINLTANGMVAPQAEPAIAIILEIMKVCN